MKARNWRAGAGQRSAPRPGEEGARRGTHDRRGASEDLEVDASRGRPGRRGELDVERVADGLEDRLGEERQVAPALFAERLEHVQRHHQAPVGAGQETRQSWAAARARPRPPSSPAADARLVPGVRARLLGVRLGLGRDLGRDVVELGRLVAEMVRQSAELLRVGLARLQLAPGRLGRRGSSAAASWSDGSERGQRADLG